MDTTLKSEPQEVFTALYGNVPLLKTICQKCRRETIVINDKTACCDAACESKPTIVKRLSNPENRRKKPSLKIQKKILEEQDNKCIYCQISFGETTFRRSEKITPKLVWEHFVPFAFAQNNEDLNFFASCDICNAIKSDKIFETLEEAKQFILKRRKIKNYENNKVSELSAPDQSETRTQEILLECLSCGIPHSGRCVEQNRKTSGNDRASRANFKSQRNDCQKENQKQANKRSENSRTSYDLPEQHQPDKELVIWVKEYVSENGWKEINRVTKLGRTSIEAYAGGTYFLPKTSGGLGVRASKIEDKLRRFKQNINLPNKTVETLIKITDNEQQLKIVDSQDNLIAQIQVKNKRIISIQLNAN